MLLKSNGFVLEGFKKNVGNSWMRKNINSYITRILKHCNVVLNMGCCLAERYFINY